MLSNTSKYAIRAVIYLALKCDGTTKIGIKEISKELDIPTPFLGKILQTLAKHKLLLSTKGPHGGFCLAKSPYEVTLMQIVEVIDGLDSFHDCILGLSSCVNSELHCSIHRNFSNIRQQLIDLFKTENIGDLTDHIRESGHSLAI